jgi:anti-sigma B factor antagonist
MSKVQTANKVTQHQLTTKSGHPITVLRFAGDISSASKEAVVGSYQALDSGVKLVLFNFGEVEYLNSSGIALVIQVLMEANHSARKVAICGLTPHFTKVFTMVGITKYASLYADEPAALAAL